MKKILPLILGTCLAFAGCDKLDRYKPNFFVEETQSAGNYKYALLFEPTTEKGKPGKEQLVFTIEGNNSDKSGHFDAYSIKDGKGKVIYNVEGSVESSIVTYKADDSDGKLEDVLNVIEELEPYLIMRILIGD